MATTATTSDEQISAETRNSHLSPGQEILKPFHLTDGRELGSLTLTLVKLPTSIPGLHLHQLNSSLV